MNHKSRIILSIGKPYNFYIGIWQQLKAVRTSIKKGPLALGFLFLITYVLQIAHHILSGTDDALTMINIAPKHQIIGLTFGNLNGTVKIKLPPGNFIMWVSDQGIIARIQNAFIATVQRGSHLNGYGSSIPNTHMQATSCKRVYRWDKCLCRIGIHPIWSTTNG